jgi:hypothetical protein
MDAVPDELLGRCFVASGDADQPALLARVACVSPRLRRVVNSFCWRLAVQQRWPALAVAAASEGGVADADDAGWRALYKLCAYCPRPRALLPNDNQVVRCLRARVALARNVRPVEALLEVPKKGRRKAQTVSVFRRVCCEVVHPSDARFGRGFCCAACFNRAHAACENSPDLLAPSQRHGAGGVLAGGARGAD